MDFSTPSIKEGWKALVIVDHYSRFLVAKQMHKTDAEAVIKVLKGVFQTYYLPKTIQCDNGPPFQSGPLHGWLKDQGITVRNTTELNPTENGMVERKMQGINKISAIARLKKKSWSQALEEYVTDYNSWPHAATGIAPADLMFGRPIRHKLPNFATEEPDEGDEEMRDKDQEIKSRRNDIENRKRRAVDITEFKIGDCVRIQQEKRDKCDINYKGAKFEIIELKECGEAKLKSLESEQEFRRNVKHLKLWKDREPEDSQAEKDELKAKLEMKQIKMPAHHESTTASASSSTNKHSDISQSSTKDFTEAAENKPDETLRRSTRDRKSNKRYGAAFVKVD